MRVKKFEAKNMKDALLMVKNELGPDAVILSARDNRRAFGIGGEASVEVTAAVSESTLQKKRFVESRLNTADRQRFNGIDARAQRQVIDRMIENRMREKESRARRPITSQSYIDIQDDESPALRRPTVAVAVERGAATAPMSDNALSRIRSAAREAWRAGTLIANETTAMAAAAPAAAMPGQAAPAAASTEPGKENEITSLKNEISRLQQLLEGFQKVPQSFVGLHPGADFGLPYDLSFMFQKLVDAGVTVDHTVDILNAAAKEIEPAQMKKKPIVDAWVARFFLNHVQTVANPWSGRVHLFTGGAGSGKTSQLVKTASQLVIREKKKVAILTTDSYKVGAVDQLKIYGQILNVPFAVIRNRKDWEWVLGQLGHIDHVLVDFPGLQLKSLEEIQLLRSLLPPPEVQASSHLCVSATTKDGDAYEIARRYKVADFNDLIFTNLDQSVQHGIVYNLHRKTGKPLHSFGIGNRIPEDFELATKERVLDLIFKLTRLRRENK